MFDEINRVVVDERVDDFVDRRPYDGGPPLLEHLRSEGGGDERSVETVFGFVHGDDRSGEQRPHRLGEPP